MTAETKSWTGDENTFQLRQKSSLLVATWDTMGWIYFREGRLKEARSYIDPASLLNASDDGKQHAAAVLKALDGEKTSSPAPHKFDVTVPGSPLTIKNRQMVSIPIGSAEGRTGFGRYKMLLSRKGMERLESVDGKKDDRTEDLLKKLDVTKYFPADSDAKLFWEGFVNCMSGTCLLNLEP